MLAIVMSSNDIPIRLTAERWTHILEEHGELAQMQQQILDTATVKDAPWHAVWLTYDQEADVMYVNFRRPSVATDSEITDDDIIIRYDGDEIIGFTVLHASQR